MVNDWTATLLLYNEEVDIIKILCFDSATKSTGWSLFIDGKLKKYGVIDLSQNKDLESRIYQMLLEIFKIINGTNPNTVVTEMTVVTRNAQTQRNLTMILGAIYGKCIVD